MNMEVEDGSTLKAENIILEGPMFPLDDCQGKSPGWWFC